ncbi:MAG: flagellar hook protein, partial [Lachnospiraceae bacterium]|nr:flagellar hook protein [Lachnospiraceae bacterium]
MVVQHNLRAINSNRMLGITQGTLSKSAEKLSSGYKVNRAADDAAGLSISEKMRKQIRGLEQASLNAEDGISAVQTAEGALTEVHDMLQRMNELAVKASNGTNSLSDRQTIQDEVDQLLTEIDRVSETTKFNETYLLKGDKDTKTVTVNAQDAGINGTLTQNATKATFTMNELKIGDTIKIGGTEYTIGGSVDAVKGSITATAGQTVTVDGVQYTVAGAAGANVDKNILSLDSIKAKVGV